MSKLILAHVGFAIITTLASCAPALMDESSNPQVQGKGEGNDNWGYALPRAQWAPFEKISVQQQ